MKANLREPWSFYRSAPSSKLEEANPFTQVGPYDSHSGPVGIDTNSEEHGYYIQVVQGWLHSKCDSNLYLNSTKSGPRTNTTSGELQTTPDLDPTGYTAAHPKRGSGRYQFLLGINPP